MKYQIKKDSHGISAVTNTTQAGEGWKITTRKRSGGQISTVAQFGTIGNSSGFSTFSYVMFQDPMVSLYSEKGRATAAKIEAVHLIGLANFETNEKIAAIKIEAETTQAPEVGTVCMSYGGGMSEEPYIIVKMGKHDFDGATYYDLINRDQTKIMEGQTRLQPIAKKFGIGTYYTPEKITGDELTNFILDGYENVAKAELERNAELQISIQATQTKEAAIKSTVPLHVLEGKTFKTGSAEAAALIRYELKQAYRGIKFRVTSESFSMGDAVRVSWIDGPKKSDVDTLLSKYEYGHFNGMEDIYENSNSMDFPQTKYLTIERELSNEVKLEHLKKFNADKHPDQKLELIKSDYDDSLGFAHDYNNPVRDSFIRDFYDQLGEIDFLLTSAPSTIKTDPTQPAAKVEGFEIVDYSEKAVAVFGDTKPIKDELKKIGGRFNPRLKKDGKTTAGWIFSKTKQAALILLLNL